MTTPIPTQAAMSEKDTLLLALAQRLHGNTVWAERHRPHQTHTPDFEACAHVDCAAARRLTGRV